MRRTRSELSQSTQTADPVWPESWDELDWEQPRQAVARLTNAPLGAVEDRALPQKVRRRSVPQAPIAALLFTPSAGDLPVSAIPRLTRGSRAEQRRRKSEVRRAKVLNDAECRRVMAAIVHSSRSPQSDLLKFLLSVKAGLRAGEIAGLPFSALLDASGRVCQTIEVYASKTDTVRVIPMHPLIREAARALQLEHPEAEYVAFSVGRLGRLRRQNASTVASWFHRLYRQLGLIGCSSHSGRRTFATALARTASLEIVQELLGHASLSSTQCYVEPADDIARLVYAL